jgi:hypothetical protein
MKRKMMQSFLVFTVALIALFPARVSAWTGTLTVPSLDYPKIQDAIDDALPGQTVLVMDGNYTGDRNWDLDFRGQSITVQSQNGPEHCIIDVKGSSGHRGFWFHSGESSGALLKGFTIRGGNADTGGGNGGGILITNNSSPTISNCIITGNTTTTGGGGIFIGDSSPTITRCTISQNVAPAGGGICVYGDLSHPSPLITSCVIYDNVSTSDGGAIFVYSASPAITNCTIVSNQVAGPSTGGIVNYTDLAPAPTITNSIIWGNSTRGIFNGGLVFATVDYSDVQGGYPGAGNINADPLFANPDRGNYQLGFGSPCIDAGNNGAPGLPTTDRFGNPRTRDGNGDSSVVVDMGAYEFYPLYVPTEYTTIQAALNAALNGATVVVDDGTYTGAGNIDLDFGGKAVNLSSRNGPAHCAIDMEGSSGHRGIYFHHGETETSMVSGFTIRGGNADVGGGILCAGGSSPAIKICVITGNNAATGGGIGVSEGSSPVISNSIIWNNTAGTGGGMGITGSSSPLINGTHIVGNSAGGGGGIGISGGGFPVLTNCVVDSNVANNNGTGSGLSVSETAAIITNCTITRNAVNQSPSNSAGIWFSATSAGPTVTNTIVWGNVDGGNTPREISGSGTHAVVTYNDVRGGYTGAGNIGSNLTSDDPKFIFPSAGNYHLGVGSPCIDKGSNSAPQIPALDTYGNDRIMDGDGNGTATADMGAFEYRALYVPDDYLTIQAAMDAAKSGYMVIVKDATYTGAGNRDLDFNGKPITVQSQNGPEHCIIDSNGTEIDSHRGFYFHSGETQGSVVSGFTITNGYVGFGGGINFNNAANPVIKDCVISGNTAGNGGGIACADDSHPTISGCVITLNNAFYYEYGSSGGGIHAAKGCEALIETCNITQNEATWGGGIYGTASNFSLVDSDIVGNHADQDGGGIWVEESAPFISTCRITGNHASGEGGGVFANTSPSIISCDISENTSGNGGGGISFNYAHDATVSNCTITGNIANNGGGVYIWWSNPITVTNCTFTANSDYGSAGGIDSAYSAVILTNSILWNDTPPELNHPNGDIYLNYSDVHGWTSLFTLGGVGNIDADPRFAVPASGDYHLVLDSPCIDAGNSTAPGITSEDFDGAPRIVGASVDMGAYEYSGPTLVELASFTASASPKGVLVKWQTGSELDNAGFYIWKSTAERGAYARITRSLHPTKGGAALGASYQYRDRDVIQGQTVYYKLEDIDYSGASTFHGPVAATVGGITLLSPKHFASEPAGARITFEWAADGFKQFKIEVSNRIDFKSKAATFSGLSKERQESTTKQWGTAHAYTPTTNEWKIVRRLGKDGKLVYWRVVGKDGSGKGIVSKPEGFGLK